MDNKIEEINSLQRRIKELNDFAYGLKHGNTVSSHSTKENLKMNQFSYLSIGAYIWTGSQSPEYHKTILNKDVINKLKNSMQEIINQEIEIMTLKLKELIK